LSKTGSWPLRQIKPEIRGVEYIITRAEDRVKIKNESLTKENQVRLDFTNLYINREDNLNPRYTFDSFVIGSFNEVAHAASQAVLKNPGLYYNPLFIYGPTGVGKTHLIQAIGNSIKKTLNKRVFYVTSESFTSDYINSVQNNKGHIFKEKYRKYDVLVMDDVQFFAKKERTQEELFHLFNNFYENNKQIIFSSDKPPKMIPDIEDRLRSRFEGGMIADINKPDYETRLAILRIKSKHHNISLADDIAEYVASVVQDNIRELEGVLNAIVCQVQTKNKECSLLEVKSLIKNSVKPQRIYSIKDVIRTVADFYSIEEKKLYEKTRRKEIVKPRQVAMYLLREDFNTSYPYIGQKLGGRDHTTVIHAYEKIKGDIGNDSFLQQEIEQIRGLLYKS
jgi:chromosomal replication initiator protein